MEEVVGSSFLYRTIVREEVNSGRGQIVRGESDDGGRQFCQNPGRVYVRNDY